MKRFILTVLIALGLCAGVSAGDKTRSFVDKVTGGSLAETNNAEEGSAFELKRVEFRIPNPAFTNVFSILQSRKFVLPDVGYDNIETNEITDEVTTNTAWYSGGAATFVYTNAFAASTNDESVQVFDRDDFGDGYTFEEEDATTFTFTYTNVIYLIRVYDVYPRP